MRGLFYALGLLFLAIAFLALGADGYWSWKAHGWIHEPIGAYLDRLDPAWAESARDWAAERSVRSARIAERVLGWPVWGPAFLLGGLLVLLTRRR